MYTEKKFSNKEQHSIISSMKERWLHYQFDDDKKQQIILLFSVTEDFTEQMIFITEQQCLTRCNRQQEPSIRISIICF
jgi:K+/H+ antiporter YhaU regulatory subunit KhtT